MHTQPTSAFRRSLATLLAVTLALGPIGPSYAALTTLSDVPIAAKVAAKPNIMYSFDDSFSMTLSFLPDFAQGNYCRNANGQTVGACGQNTSLWGDRVPLFASEFNTVYYNPNVTYEAPFDALGRQDTATNPNPLATYRSQSAAFTTNWTLVQSDPYLSPATRTSLVALVPAALYCNSDWPLDTTVVNGAAPESIYVPGDGLGADCRINGRQYAASGGVAPNLAPAAGDPATQTQYNYPWQKNINPNDAKYFWRQGGNKLVYCNAADPRYPRAMPLTICSCIGGTPTGAITSSQTCNGPYSKTFGSTCVASVTNETPPGNNCHLSPASWSGPFGTNPSAENSCTCTAFNEIGRRGSCSITGASCACTGIGCTPPAVHPSCPDVQTSPPTGCSAGTPVYCKHPGPTCTTSLWDPIANVNTGVTVLQDSNTNGIVCRHNNLAYAFTAGSAGPPVLPSAPAVTSSRFNYPSGVYTSTVNHATCGSVPSTAAIPRHYYRVASIDFCDTQDLTNNVPFRGFGTGTCQVKNDFATYKHAKYGNFKRVTLLPSQAPFNYVDPIDGTPLSRTYAEEMENYANWFAYYRTRLLAAKTTSMIGFNQLDKDYRVGFHVFNKPLLYFADVQEFDVAAPATHRTAWYTQVRNVAPTVGAQTPTLDTLLRIGDFFENGAASTGLPAHADPITPGVTCQNNFHIAFTDGSTYQTTLPNIVGQVDGSNVPVFPPDPGASRPEATLPTLRPMTGGPWPRPYRDFGGTLNSLSDIALYYWMRDLRPTLTNNVPSSDGRGFDIPPGFAPPGIAADVSYRKDPAWWQHVNFSAISFGAEGGLDADPFPLAPASGFAQTMVRITQPPTSPPPVLNWPAPTPPNKPLVPASNVGAYAIDDLWHATVNARGKFVYARTPYEVSFGLGNILTGATNNYKARVGSTFGGRALSPTNYYVYQALIEPGWAGEVKRVRVDPTTAAQINPFNPLLDWSAKTQLNALLATPAISPPTEADNPWFLSRRIVTSDGTALSGKPFLFGNLTPTQRQSLTPGQPLNTLKQQKIVAYLRGGSTWDVGVNRKLIEGTTIGLFRERVSKLGDFSNSQPVLVGKPNFNWNDFNDPGYSTFKTTNAGRGDRIYIGSNDGMMHSFDAANGNEVFAYVPSTLFTTAKDDGGKFDKGIHAMTYQDGGSPIYRHHMYVDSTVRMSDVDFGNGGAVDGVGAPNWKTILVGGLGKGGGTYYALDVTNADAANEAQAAAKVLWEYTPADLRNSYSRPIIAKTRAYGWVVIFGAGYNNADGKAKIHIVRAKDGTPIPQSPFFAPDALGSALNPSGLAQINGFTKDYHNQIVEQVYGGDLNGKIWRWDLSSPAPAAWTAVEFASVTDGVNPQPITTAPQIEIDLNNGVDRYVFFGTGKLLHTDDLSIPSPAQTQTMYAFRDGTLQAPTTAGLPKSRGSLAVVAPPPAIAGVSAPNGWRMDLPAGQRVVVDPLAELNTIAFIGTDAQPDVCLTILPAYIYARDFLTGETVLDVGGVPAASFYASEGAVGLELVGLHSPGSSFPVLSLVYTTETTGELRTVSIKPKAFGGGHRLSWRLLGQ